MTRPLTLRDSTDQWGFVSASNSERDAEFLRRAIDLARNGWGQTAPNPLVGAVVVRDGEVVGEGFHPRFGDEHAEVRALREAGDRANGATLYVTLEPCNHYGKTPPCTKTIVASGVKRVVIGVRDPNPVAAGGLEFLEKYGVAVTTGVDADAAAELIAPFLHSTKSDRPFVTLKLALSKEGAVSDRGRTKKWLTGKESRDEVHRLRAGADAIAVGAGTVVADDPELTARGAITPRLMPTRVVFDRKGIIPLASKVVKTAREIPTIVIAEKGLKRASRLTELGVSVIEVTSTTSALESLRRVGIHHLFVEGGAGLAQSLLQERLVDRLVIFQTQVPLGEGAVKPFASLDDLNVERIVASSRFGDDQMTVYALKSK